MHLTGQIFIILWTTHMYHLVIDMFIPITGRSGGASNPDVVIGIISCFVTLMITSLLVCLLCLFMYFSQLHVYMFPPLQMPLVGLLNRPKILLAGLVSVYILTRATFVVTHLDFPYNDDPKNPVPQRQFITVSNGRGL